MTTKKRNWSIMAMVVALLFLLAYFSGQEKQRLSSNTFKSQKGWGYDIMIGDRVIVHQEMIPSIQKQEGFKSEYQAREAAALVLNKIVTSQPPSLNREEINEILAVSE